MNCFLLNSTRSSLRQLLINFEIDINLDKIKYVGFFSSFSSSSHLKYLQSCELASDGSKIWVLLNNWIKRLHFWHLDQAFCYFICNIFPIKWKQTFISFLFVCQLLKLNKNKASGSFWKCLSMNNWSACDCVGDVYHVDRNL